MEKRESNSAPPRGRPVRYLVDQMTYVSGFNFGVFSPSALMCHYRRLVTQYNRLSQVYEYAVLSANMAHSSVILPADDLSSSYHPIRYVTINHINMRFDHYSLATSFNEIDSISIYV